MSRKASATLIGAFVLGAVTLAVVTVLLLAGGTVFQEPRRHVIYFEGAAQGLQVGAPVLFLGVKVGTVKRIQLGLDERGGRFTVPVTIEIEPNAIHSRAGETIDLRDPVTLKKLVEQGLRAQLRLQSILTGQLYVDLDFRPERPAVFIATEPGESEIPAIPTPVQEIASRLESFPIDKFFNDIVALSDASSSFFADPAMREIPGRLETALGHLESLAVRLDAGIEPAMTEARASLAELKKTLQTAQAALKRLGEAADRVGSLAKPDSPTVAKLTQAAGELKDAAEAVRAFADEDAPQVAHLNAALQEMTRAARAVRTLAETLEQQPESLVRGKQEKKREER